MHNSNSFLSYAIFSDSVHLKKSETYDMHDYHADSETININFNFLYKILKLKSLSFLDYMIDFVLSYLLLKENCSFYYVSYI